MITKTQNLVLLPVLALLLCISARAGEISLPITDYAVIDNGSGEFRILANLPIPEGVTDTTLMFAELSFTIAPQLVEDSVLRINCHAITTSWSIDNVNWESPWQNPGGDFESDELTMFTTTARDDQAAIFDLTDGIRSWLNGSRTNYGLIFLIPANIASRFEIVKPENVLGTIKYQTR